MSSSSKNLYIFWCSSCVLLCLILAYFFAFICDDAYISFRYAYNLAHGFGLRFNPADEPIEGYTNFLWVVVAALFEKIGISSPQIMPVISSFFAAMTVILMQLILYEFFSKKVVIISSICLVLSPTFIIWSTSGLATMPYAFLMLAFPYCLYKRPKVTLLVGVALSLIRFEGVFFAFFILAVMALEKDRRYTLKIAWQLALIYACYFIFRVIYFCDVFPNTAYMKVALNFAVLERGFNYAATYFFTSTISFLALLGLMVMLLRRCKFRFQILLIYLALLGYPVVVGGDFMAFSRFYLPLAVFQIIPIAYLISCVKGIDKGAITLAMLSFFSLYNITPFSRNFLLNYHFRLNKTVGLETFKTEAEFYRAVVEANSQKQHLFVQALNQVTNQDDSVVLTAIGYVGYMTKLKVYDCYGLVNKDLRQVKVSKLRSPGHDKGVKQRFFLTYKPTIMYLEVKKSVKNLRKLLKNQEYSDYVILRLKVQNESYITMLKRKAALRPEEQQFVVL